MTSVPLIDQIAERVERLLVRHDELRRTNELLAQQVQALTQERDSLRSRLLAARARVVGALLAKYDVRTAGYSYGYGYHYQHDSHYAYGGKPKLTKG